MEGSLLAQVLAVNLLLVATTVLVATVAIDAHTTSVSRGREIFVFGLAIIATLLGNWVLLRRRFEPLNRMISAMERLDLVDPDSPAPTQPNSESSEVHRLDVAFQRMIARLEAERRQAARAAIEAQERERRRIAADLHDELNQALTAVSLRLQASIEHAPPELRRELTETKRLSSQAMEELLTLARQRRSSSRGDGATIASAVRAPAEPIYAPAFPPKLPWVNAAPLRMDQQIGRPVLIEFWDFCRSNSMRTLPYVSAWHERYADAGLRVIGVHSSGFAPSADPDAVRAAVARLAVPYPVVVDEQLEIWDEYGNLGWPARYLFNQQGLLFDYHYGEGAYAETEAAIQALLGIEAEPLAPIRPEDEPGALLALQSDDVAGAYSGPYEAGGVWGVFDGSGSIRCGGHELAITHPGAYELVSHERSQAGELELELGDGVICHATCFTPGLA